MRPSSGQPLGVLKWLSVMRSLRASAFISRVNPSTLPETPLASTTQPSFADTVTIPASNVSTVIRSPARTNMDDPRRLHCRAVSGSTVMT
nr:hypothetical protein [Croceicoccus sp. YJ47]